MHSSQDGSVAERFNATVLKTVEGLYPSVSSNLTASAKYQKNPCIYRGFLHFQLGEYLKKAAILAAFHIQSVLHFYCCSTSFRFSAFKPTFNAPSSGATKRPFLFRM